MSEDFLYLVKHIFVNKNFFRFFSPIDFRNVWGAENFCKSRCAKKYSKCWENFCDLAQPVEGSPS
jgi:hypothetical protein